MTDGKTGTGRIPWPPLIYLVALIAGIGLNVAYPLPWFRDVLADILFAVGGIAVLACVALWFTAVRAMRMAHTTLDPNGIPEKLLTGGPFAISRNPLYFANTLFLIALGLIVGSVWFILAAFLAAFATRKLSIEREEKVLAQRFGKRYRDYATRVRRWI
jgi:protein-S-isoprenylcysteine O-methyltransferase Ste14